MKKFLGILVLGLLWYNTSFADIDDLNIPITKAEVATEIIKPNKGSAIFIHLTKNYKKTAGCIAMNKKDFLIMLKIINKNSKIII